ncbi:VENN motif pre-toxin domain-containing protein, partial [Pantoea ananatis]
GGPIGSNLLSNVSALPVSAAGGSGHAEGSTKAAVSDGNIIIRNRDAQQQDLSGLSRDTEHANDGSISPIFDKEKEQRRLQQAQLVNDIATQALDVYNTHEAARATRAATASLTDTDTRTALEAQASAMLDKAHEKDPNVDNSRQAVVSKAWQLAYDQAIVRQGADMGGSVRTGVNAVVNALQALAGGDIRAALAQGAAPYLAAKVKELTTGNAPYGELTDTQKLNNLMAHALLGGVVAELSGGSAAAGATGAVTGELATPAIALALYGTANSDKLSPEQKANLSALATLASGIAAGVATGSTSGAATGALAGKNAVENNYLSSTEAHQLDKEMQECKASGGYCNKVVEKYIDISNKNSKELVEACTGGGVTCVTWQELIQGATNVANDANPSQIRLDEKLKDPSAAALVNYLNGTDLKFLEENITTGDRMMSVVMDPTSWPVAIMGGKAIITNAINNTKEQLIAVGVGAGLGAGIQYGTTGEVKLSDVIGSGVIGAITAGKGYNPTMAWNAAGGYYQAEISGDDPFMAALLSKAGASAGYAAGNVIKVPMDKILNPVSKQYEWVPTGVWTITKPAPQSSVPSVMGNLGDSFVSGVAGDALEKTVSGGKNENK